MVGRRRRTSRKKRNEGDRQKKEDILLFLARLSIPFFVWQPASRARWVRVRLLAFRRIEERPASAGATSAAVMANRTAAVVANLPWRHALLAKMQKLYHRRYTTASSINSSNNSRRRPCRRPCLLERAGMRRTRINKEKLWPSLCPCRQVPFPSL